MLSCASAQTAIMQAQFDFFENYRNQCRAFFGREATEQECRDAWQEELRERQRQREDEEKEAEAVRLIAQEPSISDEARARITAAVRGNRQLALDIAACPGQPALWEVLAQSTGVHRFVCKRFVLSAH